MGPKVDEVGLKDGSNAAVRQPTWHLDSCTCPSFGAQIVRRGSLKILVLQGGAEHNLTDSFNADVVSPKLIPISVIMGHKVGEVGPKMAPTQP